MISTETKIEVCRIISNEVGLVFAPGQWPELEQKIKDACIEMKISRWETLIDAITSHKIGKEQFDTLTNFLTVGETYFFREKPGLEIFKDLILANLVEMRKTSTREINIWSAGCCSGEEPYTLAMIILEAIPDIETWEINILATDINSNYLAKARAGLYTEWSFRDMPEYEKQKYFTLEANKYRISPKVREMVNFRRLNFLNVDDFPSSSIQPNSIDVIFCRNVLMYFSTEQIANISKRFQACLCADGWLITSPVEVSSEGFSSFRQVSFPNWVMLQNSPTKEKSHSRTVSYEPETKKPVEASRPRKVTAPRISHTAIKTEDPREQREREAQELFKEASKYFEKGNYTDTSDRLKKLLKLHPEHIEGHIMYIQALANAGTLTDAYAYCCKLISKHDSNAYLHYLQGAILVELNELKEAEKSLTKALYLNNNLLMAHFTMGNLMRKQNNTRASEKYYRNVMELIKPYDENHILLEFEGMTAGKMKEIVTRFIR